MIFHINQADDSYELSSFIFPEKKIIMSTAAVLTGIFSVEIYIGTKLSSIN